MDPKDVQALAQACIDGRLYAVEQLLLLMGTR
jgi:hypothetical protein